MKQVSILDASTLIGSAKFGVKLSPKRVGQKLGLLPCHSFDGLGQFDFLCFEIDDRRFAFFQHTAYQIENSYVSISGVFSDAISEISAVLGIPKTDVFVFDEEW